MARALHFEGSRRDKPFVELNCTTLPPHLIEDELFGHERGAFTGAQERRIGLVEAADGGTLFLDEIGEVNLDVQVKLLKLLEDRRVRRVGANRDREVDVRIIAATNQNLEQLVSDGRFRSDLFFRIRIVQLHTPPLRARDRDVLLLARRFLADVANRYRRSGLRFSASAEFALMAHFWPGNVRELKNTVEQAALMAQDTTIEAENLALCSIRLPHEERAAESDIMRLPRHGVQLEELERTLIEQALTRTRWNISAAARLLGLSRDTMRYRIEKFDLRPAGDVALEEAIR